MNEAIRIMNTEDFRNADVLVLSDFMMEDMPYNLINLCEKQKSKGNKFLPFQSVNFLSAIPTEKYLINIGYSILTAD